MDDAGSGRRPPRAKRHHHFPKFHLKEFANENGLVWQYDRRLAMAENPSEVSPKDAGVVSYFYAPGVGEDPKNDAYENWLANDVDTPASDALRRLIIGEDLDASARTSMARYVMSMDLRTPKAKDFLLGITQEGLDQYWSDKETVKRDFLKATGVKISNEELEGALAEYKPEVAKPFWLSFMVEHLDRGGERLWNCEWMILRAPDELEFLTSDIGIVKYRGDFSNPVKPKIGWWNRASGWVVPLAPHRALALQPARSPGLVSATAWPHFLKRLNRKMAVQAYRFVYSRQRHDHVLRWLRHS